MDTFLNYAALTKLLFVVVVRLLRHFRLHDIPHVIAKSRNHPHQDAMHARMGQPVYAPCAVAVSVDLGDGVPALVGLGEFRPARAQRLSAKELAELRLRIAKLEAQGEPKVERRVTDQIRQKVNSDCLDR